VHYRLAKKKDIGFQSFSQRFTFGQRYFAISLIIAQSAFLCSLFAIVLSLSRSFLVVAAFSGLLGPEENAFDDSDDDGLAAGVLLSVEVFSSGCFFVEDVLT
jgi:hypothetical protein